MALNQKLQPLATMKLILIYLCASFIMSGFIQASRIELSSIDYSKNINISEILDKDPVELCVIKYKYVGEKFIVSTKKNWQSITRQIIPIIHAKIKMYDCKNRLIFEIQQPTPCPDWVSFGRFDTFGSEYTTHLEIFKKDKVYLAELKLESNKKSEQGMITDLLKDIQIHKIEIWLDKVIVEWNYSIDEQVSGEYELKLNKKLIININYNMKKNLTNRSN